MTERMVEVRNLTKRFGAVTALDHVSLEIARGEFFAVIGPSGCGKTTLLRVIAGLEKPEPGSVHIDGVDVSETPTAQRGIALVFQNFALFPHKTVFDNIAFGLKMRGQSADRIRTTVDEAMKLVGLEGLTDRLPRQLSGGQQQRVGLARALVVEPKVLLLDEPLGNLDLKLQKKMEVELKFLQQRLGITFVYVTHNQEQAMLLGHRIAVMNQGVIEQTGKPKEIYLTPKSIFVAKFVGEINMLKGRVRALGDRECTVETDVGSFMAPVLDGIHVGTEVAYAVRPEMIAIGAEAQSCKNHVACSSVQQIYRGAEIEYLVNIAGKHQFKVVKPAGEASLEGDEVLYVGWQPENAVVIEKPSIVERVDIDRAILGA